VKVTRRALVLLPAVAATAQPQTAPPATKEEELKAARDRAKSVTDALAQIPVPVSTEPAFQFKA